MWNGYFRIGVRNIHLKLSFKVSNKNISVTYMIYFMHVLLIHSYHPCLANIFAQMSKNTCKMLPDGVIMPPCLHICIIPSMDLSTCKFHHCEISIKILMLVEILHIKKESRLDRVVCQKHTHIYMCVCVCVCVCVVIFRRFQLITSSDMALFHRKST